MQAGRELDALVLKHIFKTNVEWREGKTYGRTSSPAGFFGTFPDDPQRCYDAGGYGEDIAAAGRIIDKFLSDGWLYTARFTEQKKHMWAFYRPEWVTSDIYKARSLPSATADTEPLAICLTALKALGVETD